MGRFGEDRGRDTPWRMRPSARSPRHVARPLHRPGMDSFASTGRARVLYVPGADPDDTKHVLRAGRGVPQVTHRELPPWARARSRIIRRPCWSSFAVDKCRHPIQDQIKAKL
jgi:hypothetical protein